MQRALLSVLEHLDTLSSLVTGAGRSATIAPDGAPAEAAPPDENQPRHVGWLAMATVLLWPLVELLRIIAQPVHEVVYGDYALFELAIRDAWELDQLLGPSAHPGFHHPGPAMFYLLAPVVRLMEPGPGLYVGTVLVNAAALGAAVVFVWRRAGARPALWTAAALNVFCLAVNLDTLRQPWNSLLLIAPMVVFVVLWAGAVTRIPGTWLWAAVVGSYELQTHVTTALFVTVMLALAAAWLVAPVFSGGSLRPPQGWWRRWSRLSGSGALVLMWVPSTVELFRNRPNNLSLAWGWFRSNGQEASVGLGDAFGIVLRSVAVFPSRHRTTPFLGSLTWWSVPVPPNRTKEIAALLILLAGGLLFAWLVHRKQVFAAALAAASLLAVPLSTMTMSRAGDDNYAFATAWLAYVPYMLLIAFGIGLLAPRPPPDGTETASRTPRPRATRPLARKGPALLAVVAVVTAGVTVFVDLRQPSVARVLEKFEEGGPFAADATTQLQPGDRWIAITIASEEKFQEAAGVILELERRGYKTVLDPRWTNLFGKKRTAARPFQVMLSFYATDDPVAAQRAPGRPVSAAGGTTMTAWRPPG